MHTIFRDFPENTKFDETDLEMLFSAIVNDIYQYKISKIDKIIEKYINSMNARYVRIFPIYTLECSLNNTVNSMTNISIAH